MTLDEASELWFKFMYAELNPRKSQNGWYKITGDRICSECPRHKNRSLYIWYQKDKRPFLKCFRASCTIRRYITVEDFTDFGFDNTDAIVNLLKASKVDSNIKEWQLKTKPVIVQDKVLSKYQIDYLMKRTGIQFNPALIQFYRVVPNLYQTINDTLDESDTDDLNKFNVLGIRNDKRGITFATRDYRMFMFRSIFGNYKVKYALEKDYGYTLYRGVPDHVDTIVITEGIFDIINIYNYYHKNKNTLYIASLGAESMMECLSYWYRQHVETVKNIVIYADSDVVEENNKFTYNANFYKKFISIIDKRIGLDNVNKITLCYNRKSKDFGDISLEIEKKEVVLYENNVFKKEND